MAATNYTPIQLYRTTTASAVPDAANLVAGELAINTTDGKLYYKTTGGTVQLLSANVTPVANGGTGQTTASAAFNALSPITSVGDIIIGNGSNSSTRLAIGTNNYVLTSNGTTASWAAIPANVSSFSAGTTGLTPSTGTTGAVTLAGTLAIANGGTGQTTASAAFNALSPVTSTGDLIIGNGTNSSTRLAIGANGYVLTSNGTTATWSAAGSSGVSSFSAGTTGLTPSTGTTGAVTLAGTLAIANGGTGQTTASAAFNALSPVTSTGDLIVGNGVNSATRLAIGSSGQILTSNGTTATWTTTIPIANGGTGQTTASAAFNALSPVTSTGDLIVGNGANSSTRLAIGSNGQVLTSNGTTATWAAATSSSTLTISNKTGAYTVVSGDAGTIINCTANSFTVSLTAAATLGSGFNCWIWNLSSTVGDTITIDPNGAETIDGKTLLVLRRGEGTQIVCNGTNWQTGAKKTMRAYGENMAANVAGGYSAAANAVAIGQNATADTNSDGSIALGYYSLTKGAYSVALSQSYASGQYSLAGIVGSSTTTYGAQNLHALALGYYSKATNTYSVAIGRQAIASANQAIALGGLSTTASADSAVAIGGSGTGAVADAISAMAFGEGATTRGINYCIAFGNNKTQNRKFLLYLDTTGSTATVITTDGAAGGAANQVILPNSSAYSFTGTVVARQQAAGGTASAAWTVQGLIRREANAASTTLVASTVTAISNVPGWTLALSADTTNGGLAVTATGAAATNIRWGADIETTEIIYA